ncbi:hypothetical protein PZA11_002957 [Diplocarpon coronariae]
MVNSVRAARTPICVFCVALDLGAASPQAFRTVIGLLGHINSVANNVSIAHGVGIDYDTGLIRTAGINSQARGVISDWIVYDFNDDLKDLATTLINVHRVSHVFIYLVPRQLAMKTVRKILTRLCESGVVLCCYKFYPDYLTPTRRDTLMELIVYDKAG